MSIKGVSHKVITIIFITWLTATLITFSQTPENGQKWSVMTAPALELPAENFELVSADRRKITVTVLSKSATGITVRNAEGKEFEIAWEQLSQVTSAKIKGWGREPKPTGDGPPQRPTQKFKDRAELQKATSAYEKALFKYWEGKTPSTPTEKRIKELYQEAAPYAIKRNEVLDTLSVKELSDSFWWYQEFIKTPATELLTKLKDSSDPIHIKVPIIAECAFLKIHNLEKDPEWEKYNITAWDVLSKLEVKTDPEEKMSLRPKFKELGIHATKQIGPTCELYSTNHLLQFVCKSAGITPPTLETIKAACGPPWPSGIYPTGKLDYKGLLGKRPIITSIGGNGIIYPAPLVFEVVKYELRNGRPVKSDIGGHAVVITGFEIEKNGKTLFEYLNTNGIEKNEGFYSTYSIGPEHSMRFE
jgi:hypothetical protein